MLGPEYGCATRNGARGYDHVFVMDEIELVNQGPYPGRAKPAPWGNNTASYLDNQAQSYTFPSLPSADGSSSIHTLNYAGDSIRYDTLAKVFKSLYGSRDSTGLLDSTGRVRISPILTLHPEPIESNSQIVPTEPQARFLYQAVQGCVAAH
jgi:hypothetical protein